MSFRINIESLVFLKGLVFLVLSAKSLALRAFRISLKLRFFSFSLFCNSEYLLSALSLTLASINILISLKPAGSIFEQISRPPTSTIECEQLKISFHCIGNNALRMDGIFAMFET